LTLHKSSKKKIAGQVAHGFKSVPVQRVSLLKPKGLDLSGTQFPSGFSRPA
jgi:hypothetical protein